MPYYYDEVTYSSDAVDGAIADLCLALGLDRKKVKQLTIYEGQIIAQVFVQIQYDDHKPETSVEARHFEYEPPH